MFSNYAAALNISMAAAAAAAESRRMQATGLERRCFSNH